MVEIDSAASHVRRYDAGSYRPSTDLVELPLQLVEGVPTVDGELRLPGMEPSGISVGLDTGSQFGVNVGCRMVVREGLAARFSKGITTEATGGFGGTRRTRSIGNVEGRLGTLPFMGAGRLILSGKAAPRPPAVLAYGYDVTLGGEALRSSRLVFDYAHGRLYAGRAG